MVSNNEKPSNNVTLFPGQNIDSGDSNLSASPSDPFDMALRVWRAREHLNQTDAADMLGISRATLGGLESGKNAPSDTVIRRAKKIGIDFVLSTDEIRRGNSKANREANKMAKPATLSNDAFEKVLVDFLTDRAVHKNGLFYMGIIEVTGKNEFDIVVEGEESPDANISVDAFSTIFSRIAEEDPDATDDFVQINKITVPGHDPFIYGHYAIGHDTNWILVGIGQNVNERSIAKIALQKMKKEVVDLAVKYQKSV